MRSLRVIVLGTVVGLMLGLLSLLIAYIGLSLSVENGGLPPAVVGSTMSGSTLAGTIGVALGCLVTRLERSILTTLVTVAVAAAIVLPGNYANGSLIPPVIYGMAIVNGLLVGRAIGPLCAPHTEPGGYHL